MKLILKNTTDEIITLSDIGFSIQPHTNTEIDTLLVQIDKSRIILRLISEEKIVVNNLERDLLPSEAIILITQGFLNPKDSDGKLFVHQTSRIPGCMTYWTGKGDSPNDCTDIGNGVPFVLKNDTSLGDNVIESIYLDFNTINNKTYLHEGYFIWEGAKFGDFVTLESVVNTVTYTTGTNTFYNLYGGFLVVPAAGDGTIEITSDITNPCISGGSLVQVYTDETGYRPTAFWNADYNSTTNRFENITAAPEGNGNYNMYTVELKGNRFVNEIPVLNSGFEMLQSSDSTFYPHGIRTKATIRTTNNDHQWYFGGILTLHRDHTV